MTEQPAIDEIERICTPRGQGVAAPSMNMGRVSHPAYIIGPDRGGAKEVAAVISRPLRPSRAARTSRHAADQRLSVSITTITRTIQPACRRAAAEVCLRRYQLVVHQVDGVVTLHRATEVRLRRQPAVTLRRRREPWRIARDPPVGLLLDRPEGMSHRGEVALAFPDLAEEVVLVGLLLEDTQGRLGIGSEVLFRRVVQDHPVILDQVLERLAVLEMR